MDINNNLLIERNDTGIYLCVMSDCIPVKCLTGGNDKGKFASTGWREIRGKTYENYGGNFLVMPSNRNHWSENINS